MGLNKTMPLYFVKYNGEEILEIISSLPETDALRDYLA
jgi:hypothetical protein